MKAPVVPGQTNTKERIARGGKRDLDRRRVQRGRSRAIAIKQDRIGESHFIFYAPIAKHTAAPVGEDSVLGPKANAKILDTHDAERPTQRVRPEKGMRDSIRAWLVRLEPQIRRIFSERVEAGAIILGTDVAPGKIPCDPPILALMGVVDFADQGDFREIKDPQLPFAWVSPLLDFQFALTAIADGAKPGSELKSVSHAFHYLPAGDAAFGGFGGVGENQHAFADSHGATPLQPFPSRRQQDASIA